MLNVPHLIQLVLYFVCFLLDMKKIKADHSQKTGCYNSICPGFVQVHPSGRLGQDFGAASVIDGQQYGTTPMIFKARI